MTPRVIALSGGIGGSKLVLGLAQILHGEELMVVANTADDFVHCGFHICPDIDTLLYTLGGVADPVMVCSHCREELDPHDVTPEPADAPPLALAPIPATGG